MTSDLACPRVVYKDRAVLTPRRVRDDIVRVTRTREDGVTLDQISDPSDLSRVRRLNPWP